MANKHDVTISKNHMAQNDQLLIVDESKNLEIQKL